MTISTLALVSLLIFCSETVQSKLSKSQRDQLEKKFVELRKDIGSADHVISPDAQGKFSVDLQESFGLKLLDQGSGYQRIIQKRDACPGILLYL